MTNTTRTTTQDEAYHLSGLRLSLYRESILEQLWDIASAAKLAGEMAEDLNNSEADHPEYVTPGAVRSVASLIRQAALSLHIKIDDIAVIADQDAALMADVEGAE